MRGRQEPQVTMLAFVDLEERVPANHPLRTIKALADEALTRLSPEFDRMYADVGRPSIPPEAGALHRPSYHPTTRCSATVRSRQQPSHRHETPFFRSLLARRRGYRRARTPMGSPCFHR